MTTTTPLRPARVLLHPLWLAALALLIVNDHVLKGAGLVPAVLTGKLSDVAGLFLAPALLAALVGVHARRGLALAHAAIGAVFVAIKLAPEAARALEALMALGPLPWRITVDPTDLLTLPALVASWAFVTRVGARSTPLAPALRAALRRVATAAAAGVGVLAALATSPPPGELTDPLMLGELMVGSPSGTLILRVRPLAETTFIACDVVAQDPSSRLSAALFAGATAWQIDPGRAVPVLGEAPARPDDACRVALVDGALHPTSGAPGVPVPPVIVAWSRGVFPTTSLSTSLAEVPAERALTIELVGTQARWRPHAAIFGPPRGDEGPPPATCAPASAGGALDWEAPLPLAEHTIVGLESGPDGCHRLALARGDAVRAWYLCTAGVALPFVVGDTVHVSLVTLGQAFEPVDGVQLLGTGAAAGKRLVMARGADLAPHDGGDWAVRARAGCGFVHADCGNLVAPQDVTVARPPTGTLTIVRAEVIPIGDATCVPPVRGDEGLVLESIYVEPRVGSEDEEVLP